MKPLLLSAIVPCLLWQAGLEEVATTAVLNKRDLRHLALMDFVLERYEDIPTELLDWLCPPESNL
ncbi:MAG: hypothetical protein RIG63_03470 [Coleofasciculus chthonoplastes F3-SA18-01]